MHPGEKELALYSSRDLNMLGLLRVRWHLQSCNTCGEHVKTMKAVTAGLRSTADHLPAGLDWNRLAAEMTANIHLGVEAGECVGRTRVRRRERIGWRTAAVMAGMTLALFAAWWLNPPRVREMRSRQAPIEIRSAPGGLEVNENGSSLMLLHTRGQQSPIIVSAPGSLRARFVDADTGQITINNVYSE
jgi:hypothetical protein